MFVGNAKNGPCLWLRTLDSESAQPLPGTTNAVSPFWSPDSRSVAFYADNALKRIDLENNVVQPLSTFEYYTAGGGSWGHDGTLLLSTARNGRFTIFRIPATGGTPIAVEGLGLPDTTQAWPEFLPDGRFLYYLNARDPDVKGVYIGSLSRGMERRLFDADSGATYSSGHLLFVRQGTLYAQQFDINRLALAPSAFIVARQVVGPSVSASDANVLTYRTAAAASAEQQLIWFERSGRELRAVGEPHGYGGFGTTPSLSPDGRRVAVTRVVNGNPAIFVIDLERGVSRRLTFDEAQDFQPIWSPDGSRIVFASNRGRRQPNGSDLYEKPADGGADELLLATSGAKIPNDWSPDGQFVIYHGDNDAVLGSAIWALPTKGDRNPQQIVQDKFEQGAAQFSSDGKWIAYQSNESGQFEIYVKQFPPTAAKWQISTDGGTQVRWRRDNQELFYIAPDGRLMAVTVRLDAARPAVESDAPTALFLAHTGLPIVNRASYVVSPDGQRFLMDAFVEESKALAPPITVVLNWLRAR